ncbi:MAG: hypothetical protein WDN26_20810 [Chitinophagaceae bacterium]
MRLLVYYIKNNLQEQAILRVLLEYGDKKWEDNKKVAEYIFEQNIDDDLFEDQKLLRLMNDYKDKFYSGRTPSLKDYTNSSDNDLVSAVITITNFPYEVSKVWIEELNSGSVNYNIWNLPYEEFMGHIIKRGEINPEIYYTPEEDDYKKLIDDVLDYLKLRKIKNMIILNQVDMQSRIQISKW